MSIENTIERMCTQIAVYWGTPVDDGYGANTYADPIEIYCRWQNKQQIIIDKNGVQLLAQSEIHVLQVVDHEGLLYLGTLADLDSGQEDDPMSISTINTIIRVDKIPALRSTDQFLHKVYLKPWRT